MNTLFTVTSKVLILATAIFVLASSATFASGLKYPEASENTSYDTYADALRELEMFISSSESSAQFFELEERAVFYDANFNLLSTAVINYDSMVEDKDLLKLLRNSSQFMTLENTTYYILNK